MLFGDRMSGMGYQRFEFAKLYAAAPFLSLILILILSHAPFFFVSLSFVGFGACD